VNEEIAAAEKSAGEHRGKEFDPTIVDLKILTNLAAYYSRRIPAAINYRLYVRTNDPHALDEALAGERSAVEAWRNIVAAAGDVYADDLIFGARSHNLCGHWRDELAMMEKDLMTLEHQRSSASPAARPSPRIDLAPPPEMVVQHVPITSAAAGKPLTITAIIRAPAGVKSARLRYRGVNQTFDYETLAMRRGDQSDEYSATIPADKISAKWDLMYYFEIIDKAGGGRICPDLNCATPYIVVHLMR
jgi:hypothetical protein